MRNLLGDISRLRPEYELVFTADSIENTMRGLQQHPETQIMFMDIELTDGSCFEVFKRMEVNTPIIFTTAYDQYAIQAFKEHSVDYLLKPIAPAELLAALVKFEGYQNVPAPPVQTLAQMAPSERQKRERILISTGDNYSYANIADIAFFLRDEKYVYAILADGRRRITDFTSLSDVEQQVDATRFFLLSRNIIASIGCIDKVTKWFNGRLRVQVIAGNERQEVYVSAARRKEFLNWLGGIR